VPHVIVKMWPGRSERQKDHLAKRLTETITETLHYGEDSVSVAIEEVESSEWSERVYKPDIQAKWDTLYKKPGYTVRDLTKA